MRIIYAMLTSGAAYDDRQPAEMTESQKTKAVARHLKAIAKLGFKVQLSAA